MSLFLQSINLFPSSYENFDFDRRATIVDKALKTIATATLIIPLGIGCYECLRPKVKNEFEDEKLNSGSYLIEIIHTVSFLAFNIFYIGVTELWSRYPTRVLDKLDQEKVNNIEAEKLSSSQVPTFLMRPGAVGSLKTLQIDQLIHKCPKISEKLFERLDDTQFNDFVNDLVDFKQDSIPSLANSILFMFGQRLKQQNRNRSLRMFARVLSPDLLFRYSQAEPFLHSMTAAEILRKAHVDRFHTLESVIPRLSLDQKISIMKHFYKTSPESLSLSDRTIHTLLSIPNKIGTKRKFYNALDSRERLRFKNNYKTLVFSLYTNKEICDLVPTKGAEYCISKLTVDQVKAMNFELFRKLYYHLTSRRDLLRHVNISIINQFVFRFGLEINLLDALPEDMLKKLDMDHIRFCRRKTESETDYSSGTRTQTIYLENFLGYEGILRFLSGDLSEISGDNKNHRSSYYSGFSFSFPWGDRFEEPHDPVYYLRKDWKGVNNLLRFSDIQIKQLLENAFVSELRVLIKNKILLKMKWINPARFASLRELLDWAPKVKIETSLSKIRQAFNALKIKRNASRDEAKKAYMKLAMEHHPDKSGNEEKFKEINNAWQILKHYFAS